jgi:fatty-acyl-CoA synthase
MRFAFSTLACPGWTIERTVDYAASLGYDALELRLLDGEVIEPDADRTKVEHAADLARNAGIEICALDTSCQLNQMTPETRAAQVAELRRWIALAGDLEVPIVRVFGGPDAPASTPEGGNIAVAEAMIEAAPEASAAGVVIALETHDAFSSAARTAEVLQRVPSSSVGVLWDIANTFLAGESPEEALALLGAGLAHIHLKDARRHRDGWELVPAGDGDVPLAATLQALERAGYSGYISVEWEKKWHPELAEPEVALPQYMAWLRAYSRTTR